MVTIGLVTYNRAGMLSRAINSVLAQTYQNFELIISDDNSSDNTEEIVTNYLFDSRIQYKKRTGIGMTRNFLQTLYEANGEYFMWLCDDDFISKDYVEKCFNFLTQNPMYSLACGKTIFLSEETFLDKEEYLSLDDVNASRRVVNYFKRIQTNIILYGLMRRNEIVNFIYPDTFGADLLWSTQIVFLGKIKILDNIFFYYSTNGISKNTDQLFFYYNGRKVKNPYRELQKEIAILYQTAPIFQPLSFFKKKALEYHTNLIVRERFCMPKWEIKIRSFLKIRTRIKKLSHIFK